MPGFLFIGFHRMTYLNAVTTRAAGTLRLAQDRLVAAEVNMSLRMLSPSGAAIAKVGHRQTPCKVKRPYNKVGRFALWVDQTWFFVAISLAI